MSRPLKDLTAIFPQDTVACLQLADNGRRVPYRALTPGLFLIGSGPSCDLRLGESGVPSLHSMIRVDEAGAQIAMLCDGPPLLVRGNEVHCADLSDGDQLQIGGFSAVFRGVQADSGALGNGGSEELRAQMLRLPDSGSHAAAASRRLGDSPGELSSQLAEHLRTLEELQQRQFVLAESMQQLAEKLELLRLNQESLPARRASA